jgi:hypothetical protein
MATRWSDEHIAAMLNTTVFSKTWIDSIR